MASFFSKKSPRLDVNDSESESSKLSEAYRLIESDDEELHTGPYFRDEVRRIDMVLVYSDAQFNHGIMKRMRQRRCQAKRDKYIKELQNSGLELEMATLKDEKDMPIYIIKIHAPSDILKKKAEEMRLKLPFAIQDFDSDDDESLGLSLFGESYRVFDPGEMDESIIERNRNYLMAPFTQRHAHKFLGHGERFDTVDRIRIVQRILDEAHFSERKTDLGIKILLYQKVFIEAFPLHDGPLDIDDDDDENDRHSLRVAWATFEKFFKYQPINAIKNYFGASIGFYFAWLGFCAQMLLPAAIVGILVLAYGIVRSTSGDVATVSEICNHGNVSRIPMCPPCDKKCWYWQLSGICTTAKITAWFDNSLTVLFAVFTAIWSSILTEMWKRRQTELAFQWQTYNVHKEDEASRPEYVASVSTVRRHMVTRKPEQYIPSSTMCRRYATVLCVMFFMFTLSLGAVVAVIIYRGAVYTVFITSRHFGYGGGSRVTADITAGILNLVAINAMSFVYRRIAQTLTDWENPRTQSGWENSFTYKMFAFEFVNVYSSIFYIAFLKGDLVVGTPGHYRRFGLNKKHSFRLESCPPSGCLLELCIQLTVIMVGQQLVQNISEMLKPFMTKWQNIRKEKLHLDTFVQWKQDYCLAPAEDILFWEYLEIVLQLGFVMMFSVAFPLAPLFAFFNALLEIRLDAIKYVFSEKRPIPGMTACIGAWQMILEHLSELAILINGLVIAFTSEFIPRLVYRLSYSPDGTLNGYVDNSLSFYNISFFPEFERPDISYMTRYSKITHEPKFCRYRGYHDLDRNQGYTLQFWHVTTARFGFVFVFYCVVFFLKKTVEWIIPDEQEEIKLRRKKTVYIIKELFKEEEQEEEIVHAV